jgi:NAD-dependent dihydropyrimidine dehydrogenase PreA subunit
MISEENHCPVHFAAEPLTSVCLTASYTVAGLPAGTVCPTMEVSLPTTVQFEVYIDPDRCRNSCVCIDMCSMGVFVKKDGNVYPWNSHLCCSCFKCNEFCPHHAISTRWILRA